MSESSLKKWRLLQSEWVVNHQWCQVRKDSVLLPNGVIVDDFFVNVRPEIAYVFALTKNQEVVFVRQYRHGVGEILLELPAGAFNPAVESAEVGALREFTEETGYVCDSLFPLGTFYCNPVKDTNKIHLFVGLNAEFKKIPVLDITEEIEVVLVPVSEVLNKISSGEINVAGSVTGVFLALQFLENQKL